MEIPEVPDDPLSKFSLSIFALYGLLMRAGENVTRPLGQSSARWQVLGRVGFQPQTVSQIARDMGNARQGVQRLADALAAEGLIQYKAHPADKRTQLLELTPRGAEILAAIYARQHEWQQQLLAALDAKQLADVADTLDSIGQIIAAYTDVPSLGHCQK